MPLSDLPSLSAEEIAGTIELLALLRNSGMHAPNLSKDDQLFRGLAWARSMELSNLKHGNNEGAAKQRQSYADAAGRIVEKAASERRFHIIDQVAEVLRNPAEHIGPKPQRPAFVKVAKALANFVREYGRNPKSQAELIDYAKLPQSTVSEALRWLEFPLKGRAGRKRKK